jgi:hypothetical protein
MTNTESKEFLRAHRTRVFGYNRRNDGPSMSVEYYMTDGDEILIATMAERGKAMPVRRNPKIALCVLDEKWPRPMEEDEGAVLAECEFRLPDRAASIGQNTADKHMAIRGPSSTLREFPRRS